MRRYGDRRMPVWVTELSWPASMGKTDATGAVRDQRQGPGARLRKGLMLLATARRKLLIGRVYWYTWLSAEVGRARSAGPVCGASATAQLVSAPSLTAFRQTAKRLRR